MTDQRIYTFLTLCELMNYRKTAERLHMTQPAVTQHIHYLENYYGCKLFVYDGRSLHITDEGMKFQNYARSLVYNEKQFKNNLISHNMINLNVGATKTIGDYTVRDKVLSLLSRNDVSLSLVIDNTENLLGMLNSFQLDILLIEGYVDKNIYSTKLMKTEEIVGICSKNHRFSGKEIELEEIFSQKLFLREHGSGTRAVFENFLKERGYGEESFSFRSEISSFHLISQAVCANLGISFVYRSVPENTENMGIFRIKNSRIFHEFNYVYLKGTDVGRYLDLLT